MAAKNNLRTDFYAVFKDGKYIKESSLKDIVVSYYDYLFRRESNENKTTVYFVNENNESITPKFGKFEIAKVFVDDYYKTRGYRFEVSLLDLESKELKTYKTQHNSFDSFFAIFFGFMNELNAEGDWERFHKYKSLERENNNLKKEIESLKNKIDRLQTRD